MNNEAPFGRWLVERRKALRITRKELAQAIGLSIVTVEKIEIGERRPSRQVAELLASHFDVPAADQDDFVRFARGVAPSTQGASTLAPSSDLAWRQLGRYPNNLPAQATRFIGRQALLREARELLREPGVRMVSLTGPPGIGKTRLSLEVAVHALPEFANGAYFVALAPIRDPDLVAPAIAAAMNVKQHGPRPPLESLKEELRNRALLLVLDNFEQVLPAATLIAELLQAAPGLKVLATSRERLHIYGEYDFAVPPMDLPADGPPAPLETLGGYEAIALFVERARAAGRAFALTADNAGPVTAICAALDGLPLAIELAAARTQLFTPQAILSRLERKLDLLGEGPHDLPPRQRALRSAIDWSYDLLAEEERALFRRLSVFAGGADGEAIEAVCDTAEAAGSLVDKNLLALDAAHDPPRFRMLETLRDYAAERLVESGEDSATMRRHALYYAQLAATAEPRLTGPEQAAWLDRLEREHDNLRAALTWALRAEELDLALGMGSALWRFWVNHGHFAEGMRWLESMLLLAA
ncbi:MAG: helix-turn-helix domain-containing protein, partial [Chloroflexia bacterium]